MSDLLNTPVTGRGQSKSFIVPRQGFKSAIDMICSSELFWIVSEKV